MIQKHLGFAWVDTAIRGMVAHAFVEAGLVESAEAIAQLPPITDQPSLRRAAELLRAQQVPVDSIELLATVCDALATLERLAKNLDVYEACLGAIMTCRMVHGDDRVMTAMRRDIAGAATVQ